jgi:hypothetical protein
MSSSCACAPLRNPPPGLFADANTRHAASGPSRRAAERLVSFVTSMSGAPAPCGAGEENSSAGRCSRVPSTAALAAAPIRTSRPLGDRYSPASMIAMVSVATARSLSLTLPFWQSELCGSTEFSRPVACGAVGSAIRSRGKNARYAKKVNCQSWLIT